MYAPYFEEEIKEEAGGWDNWSRSDRVGPSSGIGCGTGIGCTPDLERRPRGVLKFGADGTPLPLRFERAGRRCTLKNVMCLFKSKIKLTIYIRIANFIKYVRKEKVNFECAFRNAMMQILKKGLVKLKKKQVRLESAALKLTVVGNSLHRVLNTLDMKRFCFYFTLK